MYYEEIATPEEIKTWLLEYKEIENEKNKEQLRDLIVLANMHLVKKISHGLARRSTDPIDDLIQVGAVGLLKAIEQYDATKKTSFKTYSTYLITGEIRHYLRDKASMIRAPRELQELSYRVNLIIQDLTGKLGRAPSDLELSEVLEVPIKKVNEVSEVNRRKQHVSLDQIVASGVNSDYPLMDKLVDNKYQDFLITREDRIMLVAAINRLPVELQEVINKSFFEDMNQSQIAKQVGISQMQVSRRIKKALEELFKIISKQKTVK